MLQFINNDFSKGEHMIAAKFVQNRHSTIFVQQLKMFKM